MQDSESLLKILVIWRGNNYVVEMNSGASLKELGHELLKLTAVKADTMRFIVPQNKGSKLLSPLADDHSSLSLQEVSITEGKPIRMMGVSKDEVDKVLQNEKENLRIVGFEEEERRLRQRTLGGAHAPLKLPQGQYIFCDFRTLQISGVELNPPASEALKRMHMLAADPGIVAIMNKHHWRVGIMTELAPVGYVGISPKCILGFNKNHGEEISLRLRTDDLKGFRKYGSIKKTLLHELAHMVYSEHDANFYALDKQLNQEAANLDWTKSRGHTLSGVIHTSHYENDFYVGDSTNSSQKLGGNVSGQLLSARASSVAAAYRRLANSVGVSEIHEEPDPDDSGFIMHGEPRCMDSIENENPDTGSPKQAEWKAHEPDPDDCSGNQNKFEPDPNDCSGSQNKVEPDPDDCSGSQNKFEPDPDDCSGNQNKLEPDPDDCSGNQNKFEPDPDDCSGNQNKFEPDPDDSKDGEALQPENYSGPDKIGKKMAVTNSYEEPDPDDSKASWKSVVLAAPDHLSSQVMEVDIMVPLGKTSAEPDPDDLEGKWKTDIERPDHGHSLIKETLEDQGHLFKGWREPDPDESQANEVVQEEPDPDDNLVPPHGLSSMKIDEPDPDDQEIRRMQYSVTVVCSRLQKAIEMLQAEVNPMEATAVLQTLFKIIRNVIEHPDETKYKRLRKANPIIQKNVANYKAAMEILHLVGFIEDVMSDEIGKLETYLVLKRNDPGLLWLAKSSLETCIAY